MCSPSAEVGSRISPFTARSSRSWSSSRREPLLDEVELHRGLLDPLGEVLLVEREPQLAVLEDVVRARLVVASARCLLHSFLLRSPTDGSPRGPSSLRRRRRGASRGSCLNDGLHRSARAAAVGGARERAGVDGDVNSSANPPRRFRRQPVAVLRRDGRCRSPRRASRASWDWPCSTAAALRACCSPAAARPHLRHALPARPPLPRRAWGEVSVRRPVPPGRFAREPRARSVLELPSGAAGAP